MINRNLYPEINNPNKQNKVVCEWSNTHWHIHSKNKQKHNQNNNEQKHVGNDVTKTTRYELNYKLGR